MQEGRKRKSVYEGQKGGRAVREPDEERTVTSV